uniref:Uncharacterized protein n=1 Tax=Arundo donax TaxID=35708 RepID=A0A0A9B770_ARUDO
MVEKKKMIKMQMYTAGEVARFLL